MNHLTFMQIAHTFAKQSKCVSFQVGAVVVKDDHIISHGYNGSPKGHTNCCDLHSRNVRPDLWIQNTSFNPNPFELTVERKWVLSSGGRAEHHEYSNKNEIHAELNAILFAAKHGLCIDGGTIYCTLSPCQQCAKCLTQSGIRRIIYDEVYDKNAPDWKDIFINSGMIIEHISEAK